MRSFASPRLLGPVLMAASGFAALGYQVAWTQQASTWLGHESAAVLAVVAAFFGGVALGARTLGARIERSARPALGYAACEGAIGAWCVVLAFGMDPATRLMLAAIGSEPSVARHAAVAFGGVFLLLLPATLAMGATLPAMQRVLAIRAEAARMVAALYAANTAGAMLGVVLAALWLVPAIGLVGTAAVCAAMNGLSAATALWGFSSPACPAADSPKRRGLAAEEAMLAATGLLGIAYEVVVVRVVSQVAENTVYTFAFLLAVYLAGTAIGASAYARWRPRAGPGAIRQGLLVALSAVCLAGVGVLAAAPALKGIVLRALEPSMSAALSVELSIAIAAFLAPTVAMGALFSHLCARGLEQGLPLSRALAANTAGAMAAPAFFGLVLVPALGSMRALVIVAAGYLALAAWRSRPTRAVAGLAVACAGCAGWGPSLALIDVPPGGRVVSRVEGALATVAVVEDAQGVARLHINNRQQEGSTDTVLADSRQGLLPVLLHPNPRHALFLGLGTGVTSAAAALDPALAVDAVELLPEVIEASGHFAAAFPGERRPRLLAADARRFVRASSMRYDVIVSDNFHPARSGSGALYTVEHFTAVRERLGTGGIFCQWLPLHQLDLESLRSIVASFVAAFPDAGAMLATNSLDTPVLGLVGRREGRGFDLPAVGTRVATASWEPERFGLADEMAVMGSFVAGPSSLAQFSAGAALNTDDRPFVAYRAPRLAYAPDSRPRDRLVALLGELRAEPGEILATAAPDDARRLERYWNARNRFIAAGRAVRPTRDVRQMLAQVRGPLLDVLRESADFRPAYDPLLGMASALARQDPAEARSLLRELAKAQPARPEAALLLQQLPPA